jgi:hypothetical protein
MTAVAILAPALIASGIRAGDAEPISKSWALCAASTKIAVGTLHVPANELRTAPKAGRYLNATVDVSETLKGERSRTVVVRFFSEDRPYAPNTKTMLALNGRPVMVFLTANPDPDAAGRATNYFAGYTAAAIRVPTPAEVAGIRAEVARQENVLRQWRPHRDWPHETEVKGLIEKTLRPETAAQAFKDLEKLGSDAVPAMADLMDDRRPLGTSLITLRNNVPGAFESNRIYSPKLVVDALAAILNQITARTFGDIENGGSEQQRQLAVNGWRIYADMQQNGRLRADAPKT